MTLTDDMQIGSYKIRAGDGFAIDMFRLHRNKDQWKDPESFIPDRFDPKSPYFLTPAGKKRHPMSYAPFLGGKRICIGKTFAELIGRYVVASFIHKYPTVEFAN
mmetsp:Transcript_30642/g.30119  ORF Transcript_30642/g.30119 Transcript_30642/m.30119 type:complete len:104 (+) Transcript_30642:596-907(+)